MQNLISDLRARGLIQDITPGTEEQLAAACTAGYVGFDPTADSLHVGNLLPITLLMRLQRAGHKPVAVVGGATGMIGDPSGKSAERNLLDEETLRHNCACFEKQLRRFLDFDATNPNGAVLLNNYDWFKDFSFLRFIREVGKHLTVNYMLAKDSVKGRMESGISFTEFTYQLIQGYDFYYLYKHHGVQLQMGGADQWGNMTTGTELIRRISNSESRIPNPDGDEAPNPKSEILNPAGLAAGNPESFALTCPLITKSDGGKFGKTESGAVWLDAARTSPYQFYQFWLGLPDADAERMMYTFSFKPVDEIAARIEEHRAAPHLRALQKALAEEVTVLVHGEAELRSALRASEILFGKSTVEALRSLSEKELLSALAGVPQVQGTREALGGGLDLITFLADGGVFSSKGEARKLVQAGGLSVNKEKVAAPDARLTTDHLLAGRYILFQRGKKDYTLAVFS